MILLDQSFNLKVSISFLVDFIYIYSTCILSTLEHLSVRSCPAANLLVSFERRSSIRLFIDQRNIREITLIASKYLFVWFCWCVNSRWSIEVLYLSKHLFDIVTVWFFVWMPLTTSVWIWHQIKPKSVIILRINYKGNSIYLKLSWFSSTRSKEKFRFKPCFLWIYQSISYT